jgi:3-oxoacyl-[acyl-carrier-protein] synthase II
MSTSGGWRRVVVTGVGAIAGGFSGGSPALGAALANPRPCFDVLTPTALAAVMGGMDARRLSRVSQLAVAAARLATTDAGGESDASLAVVVGSELGDLHSTRDFADGYLARGQAGLSALLFPNTVMNTMAAATSIALQARGPSLTINAPGIPGELAVARAAATIAAGRAVRVLAGGVDELDPYVVEVLGRMSVDARGRGEGAAFLMLESLDHARARGARVLGEILAIATGALPARPLGVGRTNRSRAVAAALERAGCLPEHVAWVYASLGGDLARDHWERSVLGAALAPHRPPVAALGMVWGQHAGLGALRVAAAAWTARSGLLPATVGSEEEAPGAGVAMTRVPPGPGLVHGVARGGGHAVIVVGPAPAE